MRYFLTLVPGSLLLYFLADWPVVTFAVTCLAVIPLAGYMGRATEMLTHRMGSGPGGLMNATFGNAAELIIAIVALKAGNFTIVKASITGSIIGNMLFVLGLSIFLGGIRRGRQTFNLTAASASSSMMLLSVCALAIPALFHLFIPDEKLQGVEHSLSIFISIILLGLYLAGLVFSLITHRHLYDGHDQDSNQPGNLQVWGISRSVIVLLTTTIFIAVLAEILIHTLDATVARVGFTETFVGIIIFAVIGNAAEHATAVIVAIKNRMNLAFTIALESSKQIALFVAPLLVLLGLLFSPGESGERMNLDFNPFEVIAVSLSVFMVSSICQDGETNWLEGAMLLGVYLILAAGFFFIP